MTTFLAASLSSRDTRRYAHRRGVRCAGGVSLSFRRALACSSPASLLTSAAKMCVLFIRALGFCTPTVCRIFVSYAFFSLLPAVAAARRLARRRSSFAFRKSGAVYQSARAHTSLAFLFFSRSKRARSFFFPMAATTIVAAVVVISGFDARAMK